MAAFPRGQGGDRTRHFAQNDSMRCVRSTFARVVLSAIGLLGSWALSMPVDALSHEDWLTAFVRFVERPAGAVDGNLVVCKPVGTAALDLDGKQVRGLTLRVRRVERVDCLIGCHIYAALSIDETRWARSLKSIVGHIAAGARSGSGAAKAMPVLAIGQGPLFCDLGGAICLVKDETIGVETYRLNLDALARGGFRVDSQLLRGQPLRLPKSEYERSQWLQSSQSRYPFRSVAWSP